ncbi:MAG TPA: hypothetical protein VM580_09745 [Labilithrix sp.]|nr:hypothetical protein [Labilithrix sp.]
MASDSYSSVDELPGQPRRDASQASPSLIPPADTMRPPPPDALPLSTGESVGRRSFDSEPPRAPGTAVLRSLPPMPEVRPILEQADVLRETLDWDGALQAYKKALFVLGNTSTDERRTQASIYASVGEVKLAQGKPREAETNFEKALVIDPRHVRSLDGLVAVATEAEEWDRVVAARRRRADVLLEPEEKASELCSIAELEATRLGSPERALEALEAALSLRPDDVGILTKLRDAYTATRSWSKLLHVLDALVRGTNEPRHRASLRLAQADIALGRLREEPRGLAFLELALDEDPQCDRALSALVAVRTRREEWPELAAVYTRLIDRYAGSGDRERAWEVCRKLGTLRRDRLLDGPGALEAFTGALELRPDDVETRAALAELYANKGERASAVRQLEIMTTYAPLRAQTYRRLYDHHVRARRQDRAWTVATCLEALGASDVSQDLEVEQFRTEGPIRPTAALDPAWWDELLCAEGRDPIVEGIVRIVGSAAISLRLEELEAKKKLLMLDPAKKQDKASTASAVRTFVWAARVLGVPLPDLYVLDSVPSGIAAIAAAFPSTALGPVALAGRTVQQHAFFAARHLTYYRPAYYPLVFFPTLAELSSLVLSAVRLVIPGISVPPPPDNEGRVADRLGGRLTPEQKKQLEAVVAALDARGGRLDLFAWIRGVELTATRAGLLLAGDLRTALRAIKDESRAIGELSAEAKRGDLISFCASERYGILRERLGVAIHPPVTTPNAPTPEPS